MSGDGNTPVDQSWGDALKSIAGQWRRKSTNAVSVVVVAADALAAGVDSPSLVLLAGATSAEADEAVPALLPGAMAELGLSFVTGEDLAALVSPSKTPGEAAAKIASMASSRSATGPICSQVAIERG